MTEDNNLKHFWHGLLRGVGAEPRDIENVRGASGLVHRSLAIGVDQTFRRLIFVSSEHDARTAAIAQADIQAANRDVHVIAVRPVAVDLILAARVLAKQLGKSKISGSELIDVLTNSKFEGAEGLNVVKVLAMFMRAFQRANIDVLSQWLRAVQQLSLVNLALKPDAGEADDDRLTLDLDKLIRTDPLAEDREQGICAVPIYLFDDTEVEVFREGTSIEQIRNILSKHHLLQYFFPPPDHVALGLVDRGISDVKVVLQQVANLPVVGHPPGKSELIPTEATLPHLIDALQEKGLVVEGEVGIEVTTEGQVVRTSVKFKPREGLISKLINRVSVSVGLSDLFKGGG